GQAEGAGGDEAVQLAVHEAVLHPGAALGGHLAVVAGRDDVLCSEEVGQLLDRLDRGTVDDGRLAVSAAEQLEQFQALLALAGDGEDRQVEVGAIEPGVDDGGVVDAEAHQDVVDDGGRSGGGQGEDGRPGEGVDGGAQGPE